jgi:preprotein translocase subunit SecA
MTGTADEARMEFWQVYHLPVVPIPTHRPCRRIMQSTRVFTTLQGKWTALLDAAEAIHKTGRPLLIGTRCVRDSQYVSRRLSEKGLKHRVLNAHHEKEEAKIIAGAGRRGRITVATNMAGRGTDIRLGAEVRGLGGLHVIAAEIHEARRIDRQLYGRSARQGDPGSAQAFVCLEDELVRQHASSALRIIKKWFGNADKEISGPFFLSLVRRAQRRAEKIACHQRKAVLRSDDWLDEHLGFAGRSM